MAWFCPFVFARSLLQCYVGFVVDLPCCFPSPVTMPDSGYPLATNPIRIMQMHLTEHDVIAALAGITDPCTGKDLASTRAIRNVRIHNGDVELEVELGYPAQSLVPGLQQACMAAVQALPGVRKVTAHIAIRVQAHAVQRGIALLPGVKNIIAVASGKGGVGKSTTAANLALALAAEGGHIGVLDADIYGPSQPAMFGVSGQPASPDGKTMDPLQSYGVQLMSIGFLLNDPDSAMIWRGPMATQALDQMLRQTNWKDLDYLIIDLPPGTGDIQLSLSQRIPLTGAVVVTTPQDIALLDAKKGIRMFEKVGVPILGLVENMAMHVCSQCGHVEHIFGQHGGRKLAQDWNIDFLGALPLSRSIREQADSGRPTVVADPDSEAARIYRELAHSVGAKVALKARDYSDKFPSITISTTT